MKKYLAHTKDGKTFVNEQECQSLKDHLKQTSLLAKEKASVFGASWAAEVLGLVHDIGKYSDSFQKKIRGESKSNTPHAIFGAKILTDKYDILAKYYGIAVASHHTGLSDWGTSQDNDNITYCGKLSNCEQKLLPFDNEIYLPDKIRHKSLKPQKEFFAFQLSFYLRMLFSVLVDSDFTDTEIFCSGIKREIKFPKMDELFNLVKNNIPQNTGGKVNDIRAEILKDCLYAAEKSQGLFSLTVPTGGGKTLSSLAFALKHAVKHGLRRVIYVIPYTSIIEQNAGVFKKILGEENVLEHHSNVNVDENNSRARWASENWDIPVVVTTNVQFFESLFSNKTTKSRKIHNIANSVVIFDEAQQLPYDFLSPCMAVISELIENYGVTAVLCSATQPLVDKYTYKNLKPIEISRNPEYLSEQLKRVNFKFAGKKTDNEIVSELESLGSAMVVVNSRKHAFSLFSKAHKVIDKESLVYLSTLLTPAHRSEKIALIKERLKQNLPVKVISTQLIEAGVDIDFPVVYRSIAGIDSIIQAGGRANREGKLKNPDGTPKLGEVIVFEPDEENGRIPKSLLIPTSKGKEVITLLKDNAFSLEGIKKYFELLYGTLERENVMDKHAVMQEFEYSFSKGKIIKMNFEKIARKFKLIDDNTHGIVINCEQTKNLIKALRKGEYTQTALRELQKYTVSVYNYEFKRLIEENAVEVIPGGINVLVNSKYYSEKSGLDMFSNDNKNGECYFH